MTVNERYVALMELELLSSNINERISDLKDTYNQTLFTPILSKIDVYIEEVISNDRY